MTPATARRPAGNRPHLRHVRRTLPPTPARELRALVEMVERQRIPCAFLVYHIEGRYAVRYIGSRETLTSPVWIAPGGDYTYHHLPQLDFASEGEADAAITAAMRGLRRLYRRQRKEVAA